MKKVWYTVVMISGDLGHNMSQNEADSLPLPFRMEHQAGRTVTDEFAEAATRLAAHELVIMENGPVFALAGNAHDPDILDKIRLLKTERRGRDQPVGLISEFNVTLSGYIMACEVINVEAIEEPKLRTLVSDPLLLTSRLGALAFLRAPADPILKDVLQLPDSIVPSQPKSAIQIFSPVGSERGETFAQAALDKGVLLTMTSANISGNSEIVTVGEARAFARTAPVELQVLQQYADGEKPIRPRGSYPVLEVMPDHLCVIRPGFLEYDLIADIFSDYDIRLLQNYKRSNYPANILRRKDLPKGYRSLKQVDLRAAILETMA